MGPTDKARNTSNQTKVGLKEAARAISGIAERRRKVADQKKADLKRVGAKIVERRRKVADRKKADLKQVGEKLKDTFKK
jgi:hypothetical protein